MKILNLFALLSFPLFLQAAEHNISAAREFGQSYEELESKYTNFNKDFYLTPVGVARPFPTIALPQATDWESMDTLQRRFESIRDARFLDWQKKPDFDRRIYWLYPDDGCFMRAALAVKDSFQENYPLPKKIFAFGNLRAKTPNSPRGSVGWWYHVAPVVQVEGVKYVIDPSVHAASPLTVENWLKKMGDPKKIRVAICESGTYSPNDDCDRTVRHGGSISNSTLQHYLNLEWTRLKNLNRNPDVELGQEPPWK